MRFRSFVVIATVIGSGIGCTKLTDPTYRFLTLRTIDGQPVPVSMKFGPDSAVFPILSGRLGLPDESLSLPCRIELNSRQGANDLSVDAIISSSSCDAIANNQLTITARATFIDASSFDFRTSGTHTFGFSGLVTEK